jgi:hypothetical protein
MTTNSRYSENCFTHNWIVQKSQLTGKLTKLKFTLEPATEAQRGSRGIAVLFLNLAARWGWVVIATPWSLYPWVRDPVHIVKEAGWVPGPVRMGTENLAPARIRSPERPACSESLYWLRYPSPEINIPVSGKLRYPAAPFPQRCQIKQILL